MTGGYGADDAAFLARASELLTESLDYETTLERVASLAVPRYADWCLVDLIEGKRAFRRVAVAHADPAQAALAESLHRVYHIPEGANAGAQGVLLGLAPYAVGAVSEAMLKRIVSDDEHLAAIQSMGVRSFLVVPLISRGTTIGALSFISTTRAYDRDHLGVARELARRSAHYVDNALLFREAERGRRRAQFLADAGRVLVEALDVETTLPLVGDLIVHQVADWCTVTLLDESGSLRRVAAAHRDPARAALVDEYLAAYPPGDHKGGAFAAVLADGQTVFREHITDDDLRGAAQSGAHLGLMRELGCTSCVMVPIAVGTKVVGILSLMMSGERHFEADDVVLAEALASRIGLARDNARLHRREQQARVDAETANKTKDEFLAMLGHELRNPLAPIVTALQLMHLRGDESSERERAVIDRQVKQLVRLVDDLLDVSRITRGMVQMERERVEIAEVIGKAIEMTRPLVDQRRHRLTAIVPGDLPVLGDPARLAQVIANLLTNAAKYTEPGGQITVTAAREGDQVAIRVADTGIGISPELLPRIFESFAQEPQGIDRSQGGLGLGLSIVRSLVALHDGTVEASSPGHRAGSEFVVRLPIAAGAATPTASQAPIPQRGSADSARVLVADDNEDAAALLADALRMLGHDVRTTFSGTDAITEQGRFRSTVALLDIGLPGLDGYEVARRLRADPTQSDVLLVAITGYGQQTDRARALAAGFDVHMVKPVDVGAIQALIATRGRRRGDSVAS